MENERVAIADSPASTDHWKSEHSQCRTECDSDSNTFEDDQPVPKIKPEVELKEESDGFVYKTDTHGNLKLVCSNVNISCSNADICETSLNEISSSSHFGESSGHLKHEYLSDKMIVTQDEHIKDHIDTEIPIDTTVDVARYSDSFPSYSPHSIITYASEDEPFDVPSNAYPDLSLEWTRLKGLPESLNIFFKKHFDDITEEKATFNSSDLSQPSSFSPFSGIPSGICSKTEQTASSTSDLDDNIYKECEQEPVSEFSAFQGETSRRKGDFRKKGSISKTSELSEAEKKRLYRKKIKDTNPELWKIIKQRDAAQKRQKRAHRQMIAREMQMQLDMKSSHSENVQSLYGDALKERYPDLWDQLLHTVPEVRNRIDHKSRGAKSVTAYKDIIEAEKKRIYREKMKREKPEMWERQKARDAQRRSSQRLMKNPKRVYKADVIKTEKLDNNFSLNQQNLTYLQNLEVNQEHINSGQNTCSNLIPLQSVSLAETDYDDACMDSFTTSNLTLSDSREISLCNDAKYSNVSIKMEDNPSSTQSKILWFWNDTPDVSSIRKSISDTQGTISSHEIKHPLENVVKNAQNDQFHTKGSSEKKGKDKCEKD